MRHIEAWTIADLRQEGRSLSGSFQELSDVSFSLSSDKNFWPELAKDLRIIGADCGFGMDQDDQDINFFDTRDLTDAIDFQIWELVKDAKDNIIFCQSSGD